MKWNVANMLDRAIASMPIFMILVAGALTKIGHPDWGLAWVAGLCALLIMADLLDSRRQNRAAI
jgi:hypothetical protein